MPPKKHKFPPHLSSEADEPLLPIPGVFPTNYWPTEAASYSAKQIDRYDDQIGGRTRANKQIHHPPGAFVEYLETTSDTGESVAHYFHTPFGAFRNPLNNIQYLLISKGAHDKVQCHGLRNSNTKPSVSCYRYSRGFKYLSLCE